MVIVGSKVGYVVVDTAYFCGKKKLDNDNG